MYYTTKDDWLEKYAISHNADINTVCQRGQQPTVADVPSNFSSLSSFSQYPTNNTKKVKLTYTKQ